MVKDIISRGGAIEKLILKEGSEKAVITGKQNIKEIWHVGDKVMKKLSALKTPTTHLLYVKISHPKNILKSSQTVFILDNIQDPGNAGSVFRCAAAFGIHAIALSGNSVKPNNSKLIRAAQQCLLDVPFFQFKTLDRCIDALPPEMGVYMTSPHDSEGKSTPIEKLSPPLALVFGNEGSGLKGSIFNSYPQVTIPHSKKIDSLNVGISACILMYLLDQK